MACSHNAVTRVIMGCVSQAVSCTRKGEGEVLKWEFGSGWGGEKSWGKQRCKELLLLKAEKLARAEDKTTAPGLGRLSGI